MTRYPNGPPPTSERDPDVGAMSPGTKRIESLRITYGPHRKGRRVDLVVGARLPIQTNQGLRLAEIVEIDAGRQKCYGIRPVGGSGLAWVDATGFAEHWDGGKP